MEILTRPKARSYREVRLVHAGKTEIVPVDRAFELADDEGLDLILVSDTSTPPVVRVDDFKKIQYEKKKSRKAVRSSDLKEIQLKVNMSDHDLTTKIAAIVRFLERGDKVKVSVRLKGRERETPQRATELIARVLGVVPCKSSRLPGPIPIVILEPAK